jgi:hypothetical protein
VVHKQCSLKNDLTTVYSEKLSVGNGRRFRRMGYSIPLAIARSVDDLEDVLTQYQHLEKV